MYKKNFNYYVCNAAVVIPLILLLLICVIPFLTVLSVSFTPESVIKLYGYRIIPKELSTEAYRLLFKNSASLIDAYKTTIIETVCGTLISAYLMSTLGYVLSRKDFIWQRQISFYIFFTMLFSGGLVPTYILVSKYLGLKNTIFALFVPNLVGAWNVMLLKTFFLKLPVSLIESAKLDGASEFYIFRTIAVPLTKTGIAVISLFVCLGFWNEWMNSMLYITKSKGISLQYMLYKVLQDASFMKQYAGSGMFAGNLIPEDNLKMANCVLAAGPAIIIFPFFQKYFVKGITVGSVKE